VIIHFLEREREIEIIEQILIFLEKMKCCIVHVHTVIIVFVSIYVMFLKHTTFNLIHFLTFSC